MTGVLIVGAGLAGSLAALALRAARPGVPVTLLDAAPGPSDRHTWSFHAPDLSDVWHARLAPGLRARWPTQEVRFPDHARVLQAGYASLDGPGLARLVAASGATPTAVAPPATTATAPTSRAKATVRTTTRTWAIPKQTR